MGNILVIGSLKLFWFQKYLDEVVLKLYHPHQVWILTDECNAELCNNYSKQNVHIEIVPSHSTNSMIFYAQLFLWAFQMKKKAYFDIIHVQYVSIKNLILAHMMKKSKTKLIATLWGSDIALKNDRTVRRMNYLLNKFELILTTAKRIESVAKRRLSIENTQKVQTIHFGLDSLSMIQSLKKSGLTTEDSRTKLGIDSKAVTVVIGYNARPMQQHLKVIEEISKLSTNVKEQLQILLPMTYLREGNEEYIEKVKKTCERADLKYKSFDRFMHEPENSYLHLSGDVYINAQESDALSGSVLEFLFGGATLLNAKWIEYPEYKDWGIHYYSFQAFSEISTVLNSIVSEKKYIKQGESLTEMYTDLTWKHLIKKYDKIYFKGDNYNDLF